MERSYKYLGYFFLLLIPLIFAGFYKSYFQPFPNFGRGIDAYTHFHAVMAAIWVLMLIVQPILILNKKFAIHRSIGKVSYIVSPLLILSFIPQAIKMGKNEGVSNLFFPLADATLLILFYSLGIYNRKVTAKHMRYMIAAALVLLGPTVGRIGPNLLGWGSVFTQTIQYAIIYSVLIGLIFYDIKNKKKYFPYLVAMAGFFVHQMVFYTVFVWMK
jgi:hypothetical protein